MGRPLISVIVPVYKVEQYLDRCVESVLSQDFNDFELILVDDGSPDRCGELCDGWARKDGRIRVIHKQNGGLSSARNCGLDHAEGAYVSFIDSDDWVKKDYLSYLLSLFEDGCSVTACNHTVIRNGKGKNNSDAERGKVVLTRRQAFEEVLFHGCIDVSGWGKLYKKEVFDGIRYPEGRLFEDTYLFGDILKRTERVVFGSVPCYLYEMHGGSIVNKRFTEKNLQYIEAAERLSALALEEDPSLRTGAVRRVSHAKLSVLRYMENCDEKYVQLRGKLREEVLKDAPQYIKDPRTPKRDRIAVGLLRLGTGPFYFGWNLYGIMRRFGGQEPKKT